MIQPQKVGRAVTQKIDYFGRPKMFGEGNGSLNTFIEFTLPMTSRRSQSPRKLTPCT